MNGEAVARVGTADLNFRVEAVGEDRAVFAGEDEADVEVAVRPRSRAALAVVRCCRERRRSRWMRRAWAVVDGKRRR